MSYEPTGARLKIELSSWCDSSIALHDFGDHLELEINQAELDIGPLWLRVSLPSAQILGQALMCYSDHKVYKP